MLGVEEEVFPFEDQNNPSYGVKVISSSSSSSSSNASGSNPDYLSVSVNPNYQFIGAALAEDHATTTKPSKAKSVDFDLARHFNGGGVPIPVANGHSRLHWNDCGDSSSMFSSTPYPLSSSAPSNTTSPDSAITSTTDQTFNEETTFSTVIDMEEGTLEDQPYSYAKHQRTTIVIPSSGYMNSLSQDPAISRRPPRSNQYVTNPSLSAQMDKAKRRRSSSSGSSANNRGSRLLYLRYRRDINIPDFKLELMIVLFSVLAMIVSIVAITLCIVIIFSGNVMSDSSRQSNTGQVVVIGDGPTLRSSTTGQSSAATSITCNCTVPSLSNNTKFVDSLLPQIQFIRDKLNLLRNQPSKLKSSLAQLSDYLFQIKSINDSLQQLRPQANQPRHPILTGLNYTADISINGNDCIEEVTQCGTYTQFRPGSLQPVGFCNTDSQPYVINQTYIAVAKSCVITPGTNGPLTLPTGAYLNVELGSGNNFFERLKDSRVSCHCLNYNSVLPQCFMFIKRCSYTLGNLSASLSLRSS